MKPTWVFVPRLASLGLSLTHHAAYPWYVMRTTAITRNFGFMSLILKHPSYIYACLVIYIVIGTVVLINVDPYFDFLIAGVALLLGVVAGFIVLGFQSIFTLVRSVRLTLAASAFFVFAGLFISLASLIRGIPNSPSEDVLAAFYSGAGISIIAFGFLHAAWRRWVARSGSAQ